MSIVSEALRKTEKRIEPKYNLKPRRGFLRTFFKLGTIAIFIIVSFTLMRPKKQPKPVEPPQETMKTPTPLMKELVKEYRPDFKLSGIAILEGESYAIINGNIFREGDKIGTAKLTHIAENTVTLDEEGEEVHLSWNQ